MRCPFCSAEETKVIDSRMADEGYVVRRRRECLTCGERYNTYETAELVMPLMLKSDERREPFSEDKLRAGILRALEKRPIDMASVESTLYRLKKRLRSIGEREVSTHKLGEWVMDELKGMDQVAYVRFASVYRSFEDVHEFREEVERLEKQPSPDLKKVQMPLIEDEGN